MKKTRGNRGLRFAISVLLVLSLSIFMLGCPPADDEEEKFNNNVPDEVMTKLRTVVGYSGEFKVPEKVNYDKYDCDTDFKQMNIVWKDADQDDYDAYKASWGNMVNTSNIKFARISQADGDTLNLPSWSGGNKRATIAYYSVAGELFDGFSVAAGSIVFEINW